MTCIHFFVMKEKKYVKKKKKSTLMHIDASMLVDTTLMTIMTNGTVKDEKLPLLIYF